MYCNYCGKVIQDDASHCAYCGKRVGSVAARQRLMRPRADRKIAGVCAGVAEYFDLDVTLVRLVWLITAVMTGIGSAFLSDRMDRHAGRTARPRKSRQATGNPSVTRFSSRALLIPSRSLRFKIYVSDQNISKFVSRIPGRTLQKMIHLKSGDADIAYQICRNRRAGSAAASFPGQS